MSLQSEFGEEKTEEDPVYGLKQDEIDGVRAMCRQMVKEGLSADLNTDEGKAARASVFQAMGLLGQLAGVGEGPSPSEPRLEKAGFDLTRRR
ncbi:MAG: hypothetical protein AAF549_00695 [Pseudomonadota bacterium]